MIQVASNCVGCGKCVTTCPFGALSLVNRKAVPNSSCTMCGACVSVCPVKALSLPAAGAAAVKKDLSAYKGVWAFIEISDDGKTQKVRPVGFELLSKGRELADQLGEELCAVVIGDGVDKYFAELSSYGADKIYAVNGPAYHDYNTAAYAHAMVTLIKKYSPSVVLYPSTYIGRDLSPRISSELFVGLTADCTGLSIADGLLIQTRPAFGGNIMAIAGGRGMKDKAGFDVLEQLAAELGGAVGASRAAIDLGLKPKEKQVGQSGVTVAAKLYVACGISGAVQHIVGMEHSDVIIAVNKDANAPIFNVCKYGFVGDARQLMPKVVDAVKKAKNK